MEAGFDGRGMEGFFARMQAGTRIYEGTAPAYLRTHPMTVERISDMQNRTRNLPFKQRADSLEFQLIRARLRVLQETTTQGWRDALEYFNGQINNRTTHAEYAARYGAAVAALKLNLAEVALQNALAAKRLAPGSSVILDKVVVEARFAAARDDAARDEAVKLAQENAARHPLSGMAAHHYVDLLLKTNRYQDAITFLRNQDAISRSQPAYHALLGRAYEALNRRTLHHQAVGEMYASFGAVAPAIQQLEMARQANDGDFYTMSEIDARLRDLRAQFKREQELLRESGRQATGSPAAEPRGRWRCPSPVRRVGRDSLQSRLCRTGRHAIETLRAVTAMNLAEHPTQTPPDATIAPIETDAVIVGAGPVGLFQVFELGLLEIKAHVIDSLKEVGGQCIELYPDKPIYDIPAIPVCTGKELTENLLKQIEPFGATFHLGQEVSVVRKEDDGRFYVETSGGTRFLTKVIIIAAGVGSFQPRALKVPEIEKFAGTQLFYRVRDPSRFHGKNLVIVGGGDSALDWTLDLVGKAESVVLVHRRDGFRAAPASVAKMREVVRPAADAVPRRPDHRLRGTGRSHDGSARHLARRPDAPGAARRAAGVLRPVAEARPDRRMGPRPRAQADPRRHREVRDQRPGHLRRRRHQHLSGQEEADPLRLPRSGPRRVRLDALHLPRAQGAPAVHDHQSEAAQDPRASRARCSTDDEPQFFLRGCAAGGKRRAGLRWRSALAPTPLRCSKRDRAA